MKVLIVDDSKGMRMIVRRTLRQAGYANLDISEASNGKEALDVVKTFGPDLILSDWNMPEMTGIEFLTALKQTPSPARFGFVTSESTPEMRTRAIEAGALFLLTKPFTPESFQKALEPILSHA